MLKLIIIYAAGTWNSGINTRKRCQIRLFLWFIEFYLFFPFVGSNCWPITCTQPMDWVQDGFECVFVTKRQPRMFPGILFKQQPVELVAGSVEVLPWKNIFCRINLTFAELSVIWRSCNFPCWRLINFACNWMCVSTCHFSAMVEFWLVQ